jgi:hypothetical protein
MSKKVAFLIAGIVTSLVIVLVLGVAGGANRFSPPASAANTGDPATATSAQQCANPADVATLQAQLNDYQAALQQANAQLQAAYNEITVLQAQGGSSGENEQNEHDGRFFSPFPGN